MFLVVWDPPAFDQMQAILTWNPHRRAEVAAALRALDRDLNLAADTWGESRQTETVRLGSVGDLSALVRIDPDDKVVTVVEVRLRPRRG
jgi:hypothetical protein